MQVTRPESGDAWNARDHDERGDPPLPLKRDGQRSAVDVGIAEVIVAGERNRPTTDAVDAVLEVISQIFLEWHSPDRALLRNEPVIRVVTNTLALAGPVVLTFVGVVPEVGVFGHGTASFLTPAGDRTHCPLGREQSIRAATLDCPVGASGSAFRCLT